MVRLRVERATVDFGGSSRSLASVSAETARALTVSAGGVVRGKKVWKAKIETNVKKPKKMGMNRYFLCFKISIFQSGMNRYEISVFVFENMYVLYNKYSKKTIEGIKKNTRSVDKRPCERYSVRFAIFYGPWLTKRRIRVYSDLRKISIETFLLQLSGCTTSFRERETHGTFQTK